MAQTQTLTNTEIEKDIISSLKNPPKMSKAAYQKINIPALVIVCIAVVVECIYPALIMWLLSFLIIFIVGYAIFCYWSFKNKIKKVTLDDYDITSEIVRCISEEHYRAKRPGKYSGSEQINYYVICFENGKSWRVPKELYNWNERLRCQDLGVYNTTHRGDTMIVVAEKNTGKIAVAYNTNIFEYKN